MPSQVYLGRFAYCDGINPVNKYINALFVQKLKRVHVQLAYDIRYE
jgi:hypothetical protein